jgi:hypothetical protein
LPTCSPALSQNHQPDTSVAQEIRFISQDAGQVTLVWGINGWKVLPEAQRPTGTVIQRGVMQTPMAKTNDQFTATLVTDPGTILDFGFLITRTNSGVDVQVWEGDGDDTFHEESDPHRVVNVRSKASLLQSGKTLPDKWTSWLPMTVTILCFVLPLTITGLLVRRRHEQWKRRILLPSFKKPSRPTRAGDVALIGISIAMGFALAEGLLHVMDSDGGFGAARQMDWVRAGGSEIDKSIVLDPELGLRPRLNYGPYNEYGTVTNAYSIEKPPDTIRVLVLGSQAVFDGQFVEALRHRYREDKVEIWNGGVPSYGTIQSAHFYKQYQSQIQPDRILVVIASSDLSTTPISYRDSRQNIVALIPYEARSSLNSFLFTYSHVYKLAVGIRALFTDPEESVLEEIQTGLSDLAALLKKENKELFVVSLPLLFPEEMWSDDEKWRHAAIVQMLKRVDIPYIDLLPSFRTALVDNLDVRRYAGHPFEPTMILAERFVAYLDKHALARKIDARIAY